VDHDNTPVRVRRVLDRFKGVRPTRDGWDALCPCPGHNRDGDQNASLRITLGHDGRVLIKCRVGCETDAVLDAAELDWEDLFGGDDAAPTVATLPVPATPQIVKADVGITHRAYEVLLASLPLDDDHRQNLRRRGLSDAEIDFRVYRSLRNTRRGHAAKAVHERLGDAVLGVPGFVRGQFGVTLHGESTGLLVPVRDVNGHVVALKIRREREPKYVYVTGGDGGPSPGSPVHVPVGIKAPATVVRVTEGELKADVCTALDGTPTIGVPGVTQWRPAIAVLKALGAGTVVQAYDSPEVHGKPPVFKQAEEFWQALAAERFEVELEDWHEQLQGP
jgi:hypothetical protein